MIQLRSTVAEDLPKVLGWVGSEAEMVLWSGPTFSWPLDLEQLDIYLAESHAKSRLVWTAFDPVAPAPVGHVTLAIRDNGNTGRLGGILVAPTTRHLYEQLGFKTTAIVENSVTINGEPWDNVEMRLPRHGA